MDVNFNCFYNKDSHVTDVMVGGLPLLISFYCSHFITVCERPFYRHVNVKKKPRTTGFDLCRTTWIVWLICRLIIIQQQGMTYRSDSFHEFAKHYNLQSAFTTVNAPLWDQLHLLSLDHLRSFLSVVLFLARQCKALKNIKPL